MVGMRTFYWCLLCSLTLWTLAASRSLAGNDYLYPDYKDQDVIPVNNQNSIRLPTKLLRFLLRFDNSPSQMPQNAPEVPVPRKRQRQCYWSVVTCF